MCFPIIKLFLVLVLWLLIFSYFIQSDFSDFASKWIFSSELVLELPNEIIFFLFMTVRWVYSSWSGNGESINQKMQMRREQNRKIAKQPYITQSKTGKFLSKSATVTRLWSVISISGKVLRGYVSCGPKIKVSILDVNDYDVTRYGNWVDMGKTDQCTWDMMHTAWQLCRLHSNSNF